jgi:hypothetical protein
VILWFAVSIPVVLWDASFVLLRPDSMPGGSLSFLYGSYETYIRIDGRYGDLEDDFVVGQTLMNLLESALGIAACVLAFRRRRAAVLVAFTVAVMTLAKTILYFLCEGADGFTGYERAGAAMFFLLWVVPNGLWIAVPALIVRRTGKELLASLDQ